MSSVSGIFVRKGKYNLVSMPWNVFPYAMEVFSPLITPIDSINSDYFNIIEAFVVIMFDRSSSTTDLIGARLDHFALTKHVKRAVLQAGNTWGQSLNQMMQLPAPDRWGLQNQNNVSEPYRISLSLSMPRTIEIWLQETMLW
jgi:hypothetical protein